MLQIFFLILKIIGIILAAVLGLAILLICLCCLCRYATGLMVLKKKGMQSGGQNQLAAASYQRSGGVSGGRAERKNKNTRYHADGSDGQRLF